MYRSVLCMVSAIHWGSWDIFPSDNGGLLYSEIVLAGLPQWIRGMVQGGRGGFQLKTPRVCAVNHCHAVWYGKKLSFVVRPA